MKFRELRLFTDQNIHRLVSAFLRSQGCDVVTASELGLARADDRQVLAAALAEDRVLLTHDLGFGELVTRTGAVHSGLIMLRPHRHHQLVIEQAVHILDWDFGTPPMVASVTGMPPSVRVRISVQDQPGDR